MSKEKMDIKSASTLAVVFMFLGCVLGPLGLGIVFGAGVGWLALSALCLAGGLRIIHVIKEEKKKELEG